MIKIVVSSATLGRALISGLTLGAVLLAAGCGQKGPLILPSAVPPASAPAASAAPR